MTIHPKGNRADHVFRWVGILYFSRGKAVVFQPSIFTSPDARIPPSLLLGEEGKGIRQPKGPDIWMSEALPKHMPKGQGAQEQSG